MSVYSAVGVVVSLFGLVTNAINMKTFVAMGAEDGVTMSFLFLSSAEFVCFLAALGQEVGMALRVTEKISGYQIVFGYQPMVFNLFFANVRNCLFTIPVLITLYLSVAKCMCVVKPLHFKNTFSKQRTAWVLMGISVFAVTSYVPIFTSAGVSVQYDPNINQTRPMLWLSLNRDVVVNIVRSIRDSFPAFASQGVITICVFVMSKALRKTAKFRASAKTWIAAHDRHDEKLRGAELQVIKQVVVISVVYIVGNTPKIIVILASSLVAELNIGKRYQNLSNILSNTRELIEMMMSAVNIVIYYKYNSTFRRNCTVVKCYLKVSRSTL
ncbi:unnamed protein product [Lymnaea stagnalis]|uniref:G-protein coupled receptors family 1 profile domain-containing protein n=1 Tax=Lymnaea stagnalis TaxID=6523 RepID=A0AAV2IHB4_LYMST